MECFLCEKDFKDLEKVEVLDSEDKWHLIQVCDKCKSKLIVESALLGYSVRGV